MADSRIPVTMISGFLGCGKTTLLRYLLSNQADMKFGVIVNDVATINVDAKLIRNDRNRGRDKQLNSTADLTDTVELSNGCACECALTSTAATIAANRVVQLLALVPSD
jgi:G3E family GTPase